MFGTCSTCGTVCVRVFLTAREELDHSLTLCAECVARYYGKEAKTCEVCGASGPGEHAFDAEFLRHWFCRRCIREGAAIAHLEEISG